MVDLNLSFRWDNRGLSFIREVPHFLSNIARDLQKVVPASGPSFFNTVTSLVPVFEGELGNPRNWGVTQDNVHVGGDNRWGWFFGEIPNYPFHVVEDSQKYDRFSYAAGKHDGIAASRHRVWLYASDTRARKKLRRWVRENLVSDLPDSAAQAKQMRNEGYEIPMFIDVDPRRSATNFMINSSMVSLLADTIAEKFELNARPAVGRKWGESARA